MQIKLPCHYCNTSMFVMKAKDRSGWIRPRDFEKSNALGGYKTLYFKEFQLDRYPQAVKCE
jgi:hypothetical protein